MRAVEEVFVGHKFGDILMSIRVSGKERGMFHGRYGRYEAEGYSSWGPEAAPMVF